MPTEFDFTHTFRADSALSIFRAYFDEGHLALQDKAADLTERTLLKSQEDDDTWEASWSVKSTRSLPFFVKPLVEGGRLGFVEWQKWRKKDNEVDMTVTPQILGGRVQIAGVYRLEERGPGSVQRRYKGAITANVKLVGGKVERGILEEFEKGIPAMSNCTQQWLDARK